MAAAPKRSQMKEVLKVDHEKPGLLGAAFVMPMALKAGGDSVLSVYDELVLMGDATPACHVVTPKGDAFASFHGCSRIVDERMLSVAIIVKGKKESGAEPDQAHMHAVSVAYGLLRDLRLKKR